MKPIAIVPVLLLLLSCSSFRNPPGERLADFLVGRWRLAAVDEQKGSYLIDTVQPTTFFADGTWEQPVPGDFCGTDKLEEDAYYARHPQAREEAERKERQARQARRWRLDGRQVLLLREDHGAEQIVARYRITDYGYGDASRCARCDDGAASPRAYLTVAGTTRTFASTWYRWEAP